jgi:hypothetical protein
VIAAEGPCRSTGIIELDHGVSRYDGFFPWDGAQPASINATAEPEDEARDLGE